MFRKMLLATTALVVASSMASATGQHGKLSQAQQLERAKRVTHHVLMKHMPGVVFDHKNGLPVAVRFQISAADANARSRDAKFVPGGRDFNNFSKSKNALFLSYFGWFAGNSNTSYNSSFSYCISYNSAHSCINHEDVHHSSQVALTESAAEPFSHVASASSISFGAEQLRGSGGAKVAIYKDASGVPGKPVPGARGTFSQLPSFNGLCCDGLKMVTFTPVSLRKDKRYWVVISGDKNANGLVVWNGQDSNWNTGFQGEDFNATQKVKYKNTYRTTKSGHSSATSGSRTTSSGGWIHTGGDMAAFAIN